MELTAEELLPVLPALARERREALGLTQAEVARRGGIVKSGVTRVETGRKVGWRTLGAVCWVLGIPLRGNYKR